MKKNEKKFNAIVDTREQTPWAMRSESIDKVIHRKLDTGDYAIEGLEDLLCIERKASTMELARNVLQHRFYKELDRMELFKYKFIICEFSLTDIIEYPFTKNVPLSAQKRIKTRGPYVMKKISEMQIQFGIDFLFCDTPQGAEYAAISIMKRVNEKHGS